MQRTYDRFHSRLWYPLTDIFSSGFFFVLPYREQWAFMSLRNLVRLRRLYPRESGSPLWMVISYIYDRSPPNVWGISDVRVSLSFSDPSLPFMLGARVLPQEDGSRFFCQDRLVCC